MHPLQQFPAPTPDPLRAVFADHTRHWRDYRYVYPVVSRRSRGLSIGINLNPDNACNFNCVYCCVDRSTETGVHEVDLPRLSAELQGMLGLVQDGALWRHERFQEVPANFRRLNDIAFSGNGEPTLAKAFLPAVREVIRLSQTTGAPPPMPILITNATLLHRPRVREAVDRLYAAGGEVWAKLDAGDPGTYQQVNRPRCAMPRVIENLRDVGRCHPLVIQSMWMRLHQQAPTPEQIDAFARQLRALADAGCKIRAVHLYTVARQTTEPWVQALQHDELEAIAQRLNKTVADLHLTTYA